MSTTNVSQDDSPFHHHQNYLNNNNSSSAFQDFGSVSGSHQLLSSATRANAHIVRITPSLPKIGPLLTGPVDHSDNEDADSAREEALFVREMDAQLLTPNNATQEERKQHDQLLAQQRMTIEELQGGKGQKPMDFGMILAMHNSKEVDYPSVGLHSSKIESPASAVLENKMARMQFQSANPEIDPSQLAAAMSAPQRTEARDSAFSQALKFYKLQKMAFKQAESNLFSLFKSKRSKSKVLRKNTLDFRETIIQAAGQTSARVKRTLTMYSGGGQDPGRTSEPLRLRSMAERMRNDSTKQHKHHSYLESEYESQASKQTKTPQVDAVKSEDSSEMPMHDMQAFQKFIIQTGQLDKGESPTSSRAAELKSGLSQQKSQEFYLQELIKRAHVPISQRKLPYQLQTLSDPASQSQTGSPPVGHQQQLASPPSTAAFHKFLRDGVKKASDDDDESGGEETDGIDFIEALSDRGDQEALFSAREMMGTRARLFGMKPEAESDSDDDSFELAEGEDAVAVIALLRRQLKGVKKAYEQQVLNTMKIVKKWRQSHVDYKRLQIVLSFEREQARMAQIKPVGISQETQTEDPDVAHGSSPPSPHLSEIEDRVQEATESYGLQVSDGLDSNRMASTREEGSSAGPAGFTMNNNSDKKENPRTKLDQLLNKHTAIVKPLRLATKPQIRLVQPDKAQISPGNSSSRLTKLNAMTTATAVENLFTPSRNGKNKIPYGINGGSSLMSKRQTHQPLRYSKPISSLKSQMTSVAVPQTTTSKRRQSKPQASNISSFQKVSLEMPQSELKGSGGTFQKYQDSGHGQVNENSSGSAQIQHRNETYTSSDGQQLSTRDLLNQLQSKAGGKVNGLASAGFSLHSDLSTSKTKLSLHLKSSSKLAERSSNGGGASSSRLQSFTYTKNSARKSIATKDKSKQTSLSRFNQSSSLRGSQSRILPPSTLYAQNQGQLIVPSQKSERSFSRKKVVNKSKNHSGQKMTSVQILEDLKVPDQLSSQQRTEIEAPQPSSPTLKQLLAKPKKKRLKLPAKPINQGSGQKSTHRTQKSTKRYPSKMMQRTEDSRENDTLGLLDPLLSLQVNDLLAGPGSQDRPPARQLDMSLYSGNQDSDGEDDQDSFEGNMVEARNQIGQIGYDRQDFILGETPRDAITMNDQDARRSMQHESQAKDLALLSSIERIFSQETSSSNLAGFENRSQSHTNARPSAKARVGHKKMFISNQACSSIQALRLGQVQSSQKSMKAPTKLRKNINSSASMANLRHAHVGVPTSLRSSHVLHASPARASTKRQSTNQPLITYTGIQQQRRLGGKARSSSKLRTNASSTHTTQQNHYSAIRDASGIKNAVSTKN